MPQLTIDTKQFIHYQLINKERKNPYLIFLHDGLGCVASWKNFPELLCKTTDCPGLLYDRLGHGKSSPLNRSRTIHYLHNHALQELPTLIKKIIPGKPFFLIGHSDGGTISLIHGAERPALLRGIVSEAAHVFVEQKTVTTVGDAMDLWQKGRFRKLYDYHGTKTSQLFKAWSHTWSSDWFYPWNIEYLLPSIEVPLLVIQGADDQYGSIKQVNAIVEGITGYARSTIIQDSNHTPHLENQTATLKYITDFITCNLRSLT